MTGRSLHDMLLRVLSNGPLRRQLRHDSHAQPAVHADEWRILSCLPQERLQHLARFFARHYYTERIVRLFRHVRRLTPHTGRDPLRVLDSPQTRPALDDAVLGSSETAEELLALIESFLLDDDAHIQRQVPYWRDLVRYQATMFLVEARRPVRPATALPCRSAGAAIVQFNCNLPAILASLHAGHPTTPHSGQCSTLLIASSKDRQVTSFRCTPAIQRLFEAADGTRPVRELGRVAHLSIEETEQVLGHMRGIGAIHWEGGIATSRKYRSRTIQLG